jgi:hypothetical protein
VSPLDITPRLLVIPKKSKFNGKYFKTPDIRPILQPLIDHKGRTIGFYTKSNAVPSMNRSITPSITPRRDMNLGSKRHATERGGKYAQIDED